MKRLLAVLLIALLAVPAIACAQEEGSQAQIDQETLQDLQAGIRMEARERIRAENELRRRIRDAQQAGDKETAAQLREELRSMQERNIEQRQQDQEGLKATRQEMIRNRQGAREGAGEGEGYGPSGIQPPYAPQRRLPPGARDRLEDRRDHRGKPGQKPGMREDKKGKKGKKGDQGVRDHGKGEGRGKGQGGAKRSPKSQAGPKGGGARGGGGRSGR